MCVRVSVYTYICQRKPSGVREKGVLLARSFAYSALFKEQRAHPNFSYSFTYNLFSLFILLGYSQKMYLIKDRPIKEVQKVVLTLPPIRTSA